MKTAEMTVTLVDHMGSDLSVVNAARVSMHKQHDEMQEGDPRLIKYLSEHNHFTPFCHAFASFRIKAPIFVARQLVKHCVSGDTEITFCKPVKGISNGRRKRTIADLHNMWTGKIKYQGGNKGKRNVTKAHVKVFNEGTKKFESSHIQDVIYQGVKTTFTVTTATGQVLRATSNHEVLTERGWVQVGDLIAGKDHLVTEDGSGYVVEPKRQRRDLDSEDVISRREHIKEACVICGSTKDLECDHIVPVSAGGTHAADNLQTLCSKCHKEKSASETVPRNGLTVPPRWTLVETVIEGEPEDVYDITVAGHHNFLANGLVVHNCVGLAWNEVSRRYVDEEVEIWLPKIWRKRAENVKQGSSQEAVQWFQFANGPEEIDPTVRAFLLDAVNLYNAMIDGGVAPEQARMILPLNHMTEWIWSGSLAAFARVCKLRLDPHAQEETREIAQHINRIMVDLFPVSWKELLK